MERKRFKLFAVLLMAVMMVTTVFSLPAGVYAEEKEKTVNIEVDSKTSSSITLKVEEGYEYAIQVKEKDEIIWKWAEDKQYVEDETTKKVTKVTFSGLDADKEYTFGKRLKGETDKNVEPVTETIKTEPEVVQHTTVNSVESTEPVTTETATEPATEATEPETKEIKPETKPETKETESAKETESVKKIDETPAKKVVTDVSVALETAKVVPQEGNKLAYGRYTSDTEIQWNEDGVFTGLTPATEYKFVLGELKGKDVVALSEPTTIKTLASAAAAPDAPGIASRTETTITLAEVENVEYGIVQMDAVAEGEEQIAAQSEENILWQESPEFTGLSPNTEYLFKVRMKYDAATTMESLASESIMYKTLLPFEGSTVTGVAVDGSYVSGTKLTATAVGNGMDNVNPAEGDSRWIPRTWNWGRSAFNEWKDGYTIPFTLVEVGNYRLSVDFERQEYTGNDWKSTGVVGTVVVPFKVTAAPATQFTITATAGANGTISPQGNITADKGKDYEFTFKPNNGYQVSKVYIDGYEMKTENNKYTFKAVDANHTISVTFEQARKIDSPKTGDTMNMTMVLGILVVSAAVLAGVFVYSRKKNK